MASLTLNPTATPILFEFCAFAVPGLVYLTIHRLFHRLARRKR